MKDLTKNITNDGITKTNAKLVIEYVPVESIMPNKYNPNSHSVESFDLLIKSITYFGFTQPIVVNRSTMEVVDGEHRLRVACVLGYTEVPVCFVDFDDVKLRYATLIHNRARGKENKELLRALFDELDKSESDYKKVLLMNR